MPRLYGLTEQQIRDLREIKRRVLTGGFGRGPKRRRWPVPTPTSPEAKWIRFRFEGFVEPSDTIAYCTVLASDTGEILGDVVSVYDATEEGCFFTDETSYELEGRTGYAVRVIALLDESLGTTSGQRWEVISLCCPPEGS